MSPLPVARRHVRLLWPMNADAGPRQTTLSAIEQFTASPELDALTLAVKECQRPTTHHDVMLEILSGANVPSDGIVIDVGCGYGAWTTLLAKQTPAQVTAIDVSPGCVEATKVVVAAAGLADRVDVLEASIHALPVADDTVDLLWCADMIGQVPDLRAALVECTRTLKLQGTMVLFATLAGQAIEPAEAHRLYNALTIVAENMATEQLEKMIGDAGLRIARRDVVGSAARETGIADGDRTVLENLSTIARLDRCEDDLVRRFGRPRFEQARAHAIWWPFQLLGKLTMVVYALTREDAS